MKDPNAPKRPLSAFFVFSADRRAAIKEEQPELAVKDIARALGAEWSELSDDDKKPYQDKAEVLKVNYAKAMEEYNASK